MAEGENPAVWVDELATHPEEDEPYYPGIDPDGKERMPLFALRYVAPDSHMPARHNGDEPEREFPPGALRRSPFV